MSNFERVCAIVHDVTGMPCEKITGDMEVASLRLRPLDLCELVMDVEDAFGVVIEDESKLHSIQDLVRAVEEGSAA